MKIQGHQRKPLNREEKLWLVAFKTSSSPEALCQLSSLFGPRTFPTFSLERGQGATSEVQYFWKRRTLTFVIAQIIGMKMWTILGMD